MKPFLLLPALLALAGCDPFQNPGSWSATGATRHNVAAQAAAPADLLRGHGEPFSPGIAAAGAVDKSNGGAAQTAAGLQSQTATITTLNNN